MSIAETPPDSKSQTGEGRHSPARSNSENSTNANTNTPDTAPVQDGLDFEAIESFFASGFGLRALSVSTDPRCKLDRASRRFPQAHVLPALERIHVNNRADEPPIGPLLWSDAATGAHGEGAISLVAHVLGVSIDEAARRMARFAAVAIGARSEAQATSMFAKSAARRAA